MANQKRYRRRKKQRRVKATTFVLLLVIISVSVVLIKKNTPSKNEMQLKDYYKVSDSQTEVVLQNQLSGKKGLYIDNMVYIDYNTVVDTLDDKFYWDSKENILIYTTPTEIVKTEIASKDYYVNKSKKTAAYQIVKTEGEEVYVAVEYIKQYSNIEYKFYENPNRIVINYNWKDSYLFANVEKATQLRFEPSIKSDVLVQLKQNQILTYADAGEMAVEGFNKVMTEDGIIGYVKSKCLSPSHSEKLENPNKNNSDYTHISKEYTINMVWHQVTNQQANNSLLTALETTKGVTTISPTWFSIVDNEGNLSSLASELYVKRAHNKGVEVWALCDDFNKNISMEEILSSTSKRDKISNELIADAIKYNIDGINIDFENISQAAAKHYIQFLRELSTKCRNNGIVLSSDNYVTMVYSKYLNREAQGEVVDYVVVMAYDEHFAGSKESGSVASVGYVSDAIRSILEEVPAARVLMGIPFYTRVWKEVTNNDKVEVSSQSYGMSQAQNLLKDNGVTPKWDDNTGQYYGEYKSGGALYRTWLEEDKSIEEKMKLIDKSKVAGVAGWKLGMEKQSIWNVIVKYTN